MADPGILQYAAAFAAATIAGAINSVAGGGTLISFPTLLWIGLPSITANATSTVGIWPGSVGSIWGFRRELKQTDPRLRMLVIPSIIGGGAGAYLLRLTPSSVFDKLVPFLLLFATTILASNNLIRKALKIGQGSDHAAPENLMGIMAIQLVIGLYGGYFGAGIGIMMLSALTIYGMTDLLRMNALTSLFGMSINAIAAATFIVTGMVRWPVVAAMVVGSVIGGYGAAGIARKIGSVAVRRFVIFVGFSISAFLLIRLLRGA